GARGAQPLKSQRKTWTVIDNRGRVRRVISITYGHFGRGTSGHVGARRENGASGSKKISSSRATHSAPPGRDHAPTGSASRTPRPPPPVPVPARPPGSSSPHTSAAAHAARPGGARGGDDAGRSAAASSDANAGGGCRARCNGHGSAPPRAPATMRLKS